MAAKLFTREAVALIHERSGGIPRTINVICDNALLTGMALRRQPADRAIVLEVCKDFDLETSANRGPADASRELGDSGSERMRIVGGSR
jgi:hypothetical protein